MFGHTQGQYSLWFQGHRSMHEFSWSRCILQYQNQIDEPESSHPAKYSKILCPYELYAGYSHDGDKLVLRLLQQQSSGVCPNQVLPSRDLHQMKHLRYQSQNSNGAKNRRTEFKNRKHELREHLERIISKASTKFGQDISRLLGNITM